jgi:hypothetical protein
VQALFVANPKGPPVLTTRRLFAGLWLALAAHAALSAPAAPHAGVLAQQKEDLAAARPYVLSSKAFSEADRAAALARIDQDLQRTEPWTPAGFLLETMRITAMAHNGHDAVYTERGWSPDSRLPLRLSWLADGVVITRAAPQLAQLAGRRVLAVDGHGLPELMQAWRTVNGGTDAYIRWNDAWMLEHPVMLHALGLAARPDRVTLTLQDAHGGVEAQEVQEVPSSTLPDDLGRLGVWSRALSPAERAAGWVTAVTAAEDPLRLQDGERSFRLVQLPALDALYVQFRGNADGREGESIAAFAQQVQQRLKSTALHHLVLDERLNRGGNADLTEDLMRDIGRWRRGRLYVLLGPQTFSAGIVSAALVVHEAGGRAVIVGDRVGDRLRWWSESAPAVCLPHAGYCLHGSTGLWDLVHGCAGEPHCYGDRFHAQVPGLAPVLTAPLRVSDLLLGRDAAMQAVERDIAAQPARR